MLCELSFLGVLYLGYFFKNIVYGCCVGMCRSGGLLRLASLMINVLVYILVK